MSTLPELPSRESLLDFRLLVEAASDIVAVTEVDTTIRYVSGAVLRVLGYLPRELVGRRVKELMTPEAVAALDERLSPVAAGRPPSSEPRTYEFRARDGAARYLEVLASDLRSNPRIGGLCVVARDVTERVLGERERASQQERQRLAARLARVGVWEWDVDSRTMIADESVRGLLRQHQGQSWQGPEDFVGRFVPEDRARLDGAMRAAMSGTEPGQCTVRLALPDGSVRWLYLYGQRMESAQGQRRVLGLVMDVSAQKLAEIELAERRDTLALALNAAGMTAWTWDPAQDALVTDERFAAMVGLPPGTRSITLARWEQLVHPDDVAMMRGIASDLVEGRSETFDVAYRLRRAEGGWRWVLDRGRVASRGPDGRATRVYGVALDIDERKRTEAELAEQRLRLRLALDASRLGLWDWDVDRQQLFVDERYCEILETTADVVLDHPEMLYERLHPDDRARLDALARDVLADRSKTLAFEGRLGRPDGTVVTITIHGAVSGRDPAGHPNRLTGTIADVTDAERARQMARISEDIARVGSYDFDLTTRRIQWSAGCYRLFGLPEDHQPDVESTMRLVAPASLERASELFRAAREDGEPFDAELEFRDAAGAPIWVRMVGRVESFGGRPVRVYGIVQDISARKRLERELLEVANREQQRLGSELHDGLGQELAGVSMMLEAMAQQLGEVRPALRNQFEHLRALVTQAIQGTRALAHGLAPVSLQRGGLEGALGMLASQVRMSGGVEVDLDLDVEAPLMLGEVAGNHLFRIAQEAVGNALRHAHPRHIVIALRSSPGEVSLSVEDDGSGFPGDLPPGGGFGLRSMRYRAQEIEGMLEIRPRDGGGTRVTTTCPQPRS